MRGAAARVDVAAVGIVVQRGDLRTERREHRRRRRARRAVRAVDHEQHAVEIEPRDGAATFVRARTAAEAVGRQQGGEVALGEAEAGSGWQAVTVDGDAWGRIRPRDRMRFRRD